MKKRLVIALSILSLTLVPAATAANFELNENKLEEYGETANQYTDELPAFVIDLVNDKNINVYIDSEQTDNYNLSIKMNGTTVEKVKNSSIEDPDLEVWTSTNVIENITESDQPVQTMRSAINNDEIEYQANDTWTKIKLFFAETFMNMF